MDSFFAITASSIPQNRRGKMAMYPIGTLITGGLKTKGVQRKDLVRALGYSNFNKGRRNLDACMDHGECSNEFLRKHLPLVLGLTPAQVEEAIHLTEEKRRQEADQEARAQFQPHIYVEVKRTAPIFAIAFSGAGRNLYIDLPPDLPSLPEEEQIERIRQLVRQHYLANNGKCRLVGDIRYYVLRRTYDESILFQPEGEILARYDKPYKEAKATLQIGNKILEGSGHIRPA